MTWTYIIELLPGFVYSVHKNPFDLEHVFGKQKSDFQTGYNPLIDMDRLFVFEHVRWGVRGWKKVYQPESVSIDYKMHWIKKNEVYGSASETTISFFTANEHESDHIKFSFDLVFRSFGSLSKYCFFRHWEFLFNDILFNAIKFKY